MFGNRQPQTGSPRFTRARRVHTIEPFKNARLVGLGNADARVRYREDDFQFLHLCAEDNLSSRQGVLSGIVEEVFAIPRQASCGPPQRWAFVRERSRKGAVRSPLPDVGLSPGSYPQFAPR